MQLIETADPSSRLPLDWCAAHVTSTAGSRSSASQCGPHLNNAPAPASKARSTSQRIQGEPPAPLARREARVGSCSPAAEPLSELAECVAARLVPAASPAPGSVAPADPQGPATFSPPPPPPPLLAPPVVPGVVPCVGGVVAAWRVAVVPGACDTDVVVWSGVVVPGVGASVLEVCPGDVVTGVCDTVVVVCAVVGAAGIQTRGEEETTGAY